MSGTKKTSACGATAPQSPKRRRAPEGARNPQSRTSTIEALADDEAMIDYGPAVEALDDLAGWAFGLAQKDVDGWPEGARRVRNAHRYIRAVLRGKTPRTEPREDLLFTGALLVRVFEADFGLGVDHVADVLGHLGLPIDHAPDTRAANASRSQPAPISPSACRHLRAIQRLLSPADAAAARDEADRLSPSERAAWVVALSRFAVDDAAQIVSAYLRSEIEARYAAPSTNGYPLVFVRVRRPA